MNHNEKAAAIHPALVYLKDFESQYLAVDPAFWKVVDGARTPMAIKERPYVYCEQTAVYKAIHNRKALYKSMATRAINDVNPNLPEDERRAVGSQIVHGYLADICAMGAFRSSKYIIKIHPGLEGMLATSAVPKEIPSSIFKQLPAWGFFLEFGDEYLADEGKALDGYHGIFVSMYDREPKTTVLYMDLLTRGVMPPLSLCMNVDEKVDIEDVIRAFERSDKTNILGTVDLPGDVRHSLYEITTRYVANACLYLSSKDAEYSGPARPSQPNRVKSAYGQVIPEPDKPVTFELGARMGAQLMAVRQAQGDTTFTTRAGTRPFTPHVRMAHWHHFWEGSRKNPEERRLTVKFLHQIKVRYDDADTLQAAIRPVAPQVDAELPEEENEVEAAAPRG